MNPRRIKMFLYPQALEHDGMCPEFSNVLPFSAKGREDWCDLVGPKDAEIFYCGQLTDRNPSLIDPKRFEYLDGNEKRHVMDIDGDWPGMEFPSWLKDITITARNVLKSHVGWTAYPTPGASMLMINLLAKERTYKEPTWHGFYFRGRLDQMGHRVKMYRALQLSNVPHNFSINQTAYMFPSDSTLGPYTKESLNENLGRYEKEMLDWSFALCPRSGSHFTMRFYEACALGRYPIVLGDNLWLDHSEVKAYTIPADTSELKIVSALRSLMQMPMELVSEYGKQAKDYFDLCVKPYFDDPTKAFIIWLRQQGIIN